MRWIAPTKTGCVSSRTMARTRSSSCTKNPSDTRHRSELNVCCKHEAMAFTYTLTRDCHCTIGGGTCPSPFTQEYRCGGECSALSSGWGVLTGEFFGDKVDVSIRERHIDMKGVPWLIENGSNFCSSFREFYGFWRSLFSHCSTPCVSVSQTRGWARKKFSSGCKIISAFQQTIGG